VVTLVFLPKEADVTKRKKELGDEYTQIIYPNHSHRMIVDDTGEPVKLPELSRQQKANIAEPMREIVDLFRLQRHMYLHPDEAILPEPQPTKPPSKSNQRARERHKLRRAEREAQI
jgi:hypothetical protein